MSRFPDCLDNIDARIHELHLASTSIPHLAIMSDILYYLYPSRVYGIDSLFVMADFPANHRTDLLFV